MTVEYRIKLSTIVKADRDNSKRDYVCQYIKRKLLSDKDQTIKPIVIIDVVPDDYEQYVASGFLDFFAHPFAKEVLKPTFKFKNGIKKERLSVFFENYKKTLDYYEEMGVIKNQGERSDEGE